MLKTPLEFKFKAMVTFSDLSATGNYHQIKLKFDTYYSYPSLNQRTDDFYTYVPTCHLNGYRIESCTISGGKIIMSFKQLLVGGSESAVRFSVLNPKD